MHRSPCALLLLAVALVPASALANLGPNPDGTSVLLVVVLVQLAASVALAIRGTRPLLTSAALGLSFLGLSSTISSEVGLLFQAPAAVFILLAGVTASRNVRLLGLFATLVALIGIPLGTVKAREPRGFVGFSKPALEAELQRQSDPGRTRRLHDFDSIREAGPLDAGGPGPDVGREFPDAGVDR